MARVKLVIGSIKEQLRALEKRIKEALEKGEDITIITTNDLEALTVINAVLEFLKGVDGSIKQEDVDKTLDITMIDENGKEHKVRVTREGLDFDVWHVIARDIAFKFVELVQRIENE